ncbi:MAG TPA: nucleotide sugar dehydrogenase [Chloroflexota bacterium]|nr:nucleotide sugar dehydrogenase [Chloroflexota bacterium]
MSGRVCVFGLWHLGCVTAACLAEQGLTVVGLDLDAARVDELRRGRPPVAEPGLAELIQAELDRGTLSFAADPASALSNATTVWVAFDTPVGDHDEADVGWVRAQLEAIRAHLVPGTLVIISAQVPVGFGAELERDWRRSDGSLRFASVPENLRLGAALEAFRGPERVIVGLGQDVDRQAIRGLFPVCDERIEWMSLESAEMTKHALNGFLALSVAYANEVARICEQVGADATQVERGLRTDSRIGPRAYVSAGAPIAGGTLMRDVTFMLELAARHGLESPVLRGIQESNKLHTGWILDRLVELLAHIAEPRVALLGLTYKVGTDTLRRSASVELARRLSADGVLVHAYDPAIRQLVGGLPVRLMGGIDEALWGVDVAVLATPWPEFKAVDADRLVRAMRRPQLIDQAGFLSHLAADDRIRYVRVGRPLAATTSV